MVTILEIEEREQQLKEVEAQAIEASRTRVPERKYGAGITPEQQRLAQARRNEGINVLQQVKTQKEQLKDVKNQVIENQRIQAQIDAANSRKAAYERAVKLVESGKSYAVNWLKGPEYTDLKRYVKELEQQRSSNAEAKRVTLAKYEAQGLKPVYNAGKLVGFEDTIRQQSIGLEAIPKLPGMDLLRYEKAGVVTLEKVQVNTNEQILAKLNIKETEAQKKFMASSELYVSQFQTSSVGYQPFFGKVERVIKYPFEKAAQRIEKPTKEQQYITNVVSYTPLKAETIPYEVYQTRRANAVRYAGEFIAFPVYGFKQTERYILDKQAREEYAALRPGQKLLEITNVGLSYWSAESLARSGIKFLKEPIKIKEELKLPSEYFAKTEIKNIKINDKMTNIAEFNVISVSYPQRAVTIPRWEAALSGLKLNDPRLDKFSLEQVKNMLANTKYVELKPLRISQSITEPFFIKGGQITNALGRTGKPAVFSYRQSIYTLKGSTRFTGKELSILSGETYGSTSIRTISESRKELAPNIKKALEEIEKLQSPKGFNIKEIFDKELNLQEGAVKLEDFFKITNKGVKAIPYGKRTSRADIAAIQKSFFEFKLEGKEYGLKEVEILGEKIGVVDTTFPAKMREVKIKKIINPLEDKNIIKHYTKEENIPKILKEGFKTDRKPLIPVDETGRKLGQADKVLYFTKENSKQLAPLYAEIKSTAKVKTIRTEKQFRELIEEGKKTKGDLVYPADYAIRGAKKKGYDILEQKFTKNFATLSKNKYLRFVQEKIIGKEFIGLQRFEELTNTGGGFYAPNDFFILNKKSIKLIGGEKDLPIKQIKEFTQLKEYPRKAINIKGIVNRYEYEFQYSEPVNVMRGSGPKTKLTFSSQDQKAIQEAIGSVAVKQAKLPAVKLNVIKLGNVLEPVQKSLPAYTGAGLYERTEELGARYSPSYQMPSYVPSYKPMVREMNIPRFDYVEKYLPREITKDLTKAINKDIVKELSKNIPKLSPKEITKQTPKEVVKQSFKFNIKNAPKLAFPPYNPPMPKPPKEFKLPKINLGEGKPRDYVPGYKPFVIKKGERLYIGDILPRGKALKEAEEEARKTLRATFGIEKTKTKIKEADISFTPSKKLFRAFRIKEGKKIPLKDTFIQKLNKRLSSKGEIKEIQIFRRLKL